jgi:hypothetical protein
LRFKHIFSNGINNMRVKSGLGKRFKMLKIKRSLAIILVLSVAPLIICCNPEDVPPVYPAEVTFADLVSNPEAYHDKEIIIDGYWFDGFEIVVLAERLKDDDYTQGNLKPAGALIWIQGGLSEEVLGGLYLQPNNPTGYPAHYGKIRLTGTLEYGGQYGHLGAYEYRLTIHDSETLPWNP